MPSSPLLRTLPYSDIIHDLAINDLPYMFLLMVGIALIRKPFVATAMVFLNFLLMQLLFPGDKSSALKAILDPPARSTLESDLSCSDDRLSGVKVSSFVLFGSAAGA